VADGPQIEANIEYVLSNYTSSFGTPYDVVRIQMPPETGAYPNTNGDYRTYTNLVFVNKTVLVPVYEEEFDTPALEILQSELPGYNVVGIECNDIIQLSGAIHCITKAVGVSDPLLIVEQHVDDVEQELVDIQIDATVKHTSGIESAQVQYRVDGGDFMVLEMALTNVDEDIWTADIPGQLEGSVIDYYISATAVSGKQQKRPLTAPEGFWTFEVLGTAVGLDEFDGVEPLLPIYPNPAQGITVIPVNMPQTVMVQIELVDIMGRVVDVIHQGSAARGEQKYFFDASATSPGVYQVRLIVGDRSFSQKLMIR
ncbi:MAG: T9SS type A sorting domain-containing protein, partial [Flavobacteriales bacterium]|nr:T9SS type A sorting domain-containing protein [Flavobacteriales bacterium]